VILTFKYRLLPTSAQHATLAAILEGQRLLYNAALEERIGCYRHTGEGRSYVDQCKGLTEWRDLDPEAAAVPVSLQRWTLWSVQLAFDGFFRRIKARQGRAGYPRFKSKARWRSFGFREMHGLRFDGRQLRLRGLPSGIRVHLHRPMPEEATLRSVVFRCDHKGWSACFALELPETAVRKGCRAVGIDLGLRVLAVLSDGSSVPNPRHARRAQRELRRRQRALARCKRGSRRREKLRRALTRCHAKTVATRNTALHQASARIVFDYDVIAVEALNVKGLAQTHLAGAVHDAAWTNFTKMLRYKAERAGARLIEVDPRNTSQRCSGCGVIVPKDLSMRTHECPDCGLILDRDVNAARNVLQRAVAGP
jgi:putative transposase